MFTFTVNPDLLDRDKVAHSELGSYTIMVNTPEIKRVLRARYGRRNLAFKVFKGMTGYRTISADAKNPLWGKATVLEATIIQNLFAHEGISPRIYGFASVNGLLAQVTEYVERTLDPKPAEHQVRVAKLKALIEKYNLTSISKTPDYGMGNWRNNKFIDFSHLRFTDFDAYKQSLNIRARTRRGKVLEKAYQPVPELGIVGSRDVIARAHNLNLNSLEFENKSVLNIGCNLGWFCRFAIDHGARRVIGIDKMGELSFEINNVLGYGNLDIVTAKIPDYISHKRKANSRWKFDIVFLMAVQNYIGGIEQTLNLVLPVVKHLLVVESHGGEDRFEYEKVFDKLGLTTRIYKGYIKDPQIRHQWILTK